MADPTPPDDAPADPPAGVIRSAKFRRDLLAKLPPLAHAGWTAKDDFKLDDEWGAAVHLRSDALLGPLEPLAPDDLK